MNFLAGCLVLVCMASVLEAKEVDPAKRYTVICDYVGVDLDPQYLPEDFVIDEEQSLKLANATVVISAEIRNEKGETHFEKLSSAQMENGRAVLEGETDESIHVSIAIVSSDKELFSTRSVLAPRKVVSAVILNYRHPYARDRLVLAGNSHLAVNPERKFTVVGNLSSEDADLSQTTASVTTYGSNPRINFGTVLLVDGCFLIEGEVEEPTVVSISISTGNSGWGGSALAIVEPNSVIRIVPDGPARHQMLATSGTGKHLQLIESWLLTEDYRSLVDAYTVAVEEFSEEYKARQHVSSQNGSSNLSPIQETDAYKKQNQLWEQLWTFRKDTVDSMARTAEDPFNRLLALEMSWIHPADKLTIYDELALLLDDDLVARRVKPARDELFGRLQDAARRNSLEVGAQAPKFSLPNLKGEGIALSEVLAENELILIDFWASWCAPCIAQFPKLKELYADHKANGFEVISISIDDTLEKWRDASTEQSLPWLDLADIGGYSGDVPISYGVFYVPMNYLLDSKGLVVQKGIKPDQLKELLDTRLKETL